MSRKHCLFVLVSILIVTFGCVLYDFNGQSFDISDREVRLIVTDSMDGNVSEYQIHSFPKNTLVMIQKVDADRISEMIHIGDVVSFRQGGIYNHHRVVSIHMDDGYIETKGDNSYFSESVQLGDVCGKVVGTNHIIGEILAFAHNHIWLVLAVMFVIVASDYVYVTLKNEKQKEKEQYEYNA